MENGTVKYWKLKVEDLEAELRFSQDDFKLSQQQCRYQADEISGLNIELSKAKMDLVKFRRLENQNE